VRALSAAAAAQDGTVARLAGAAVAESVASAAAEGGDAAALVAALEPLAAAAREGLAPSLERLRAEIARDGATPSVPKSLAGGTRKRVVVVGGGFCGAMVSYRLDKIPELHVTLLDTKEYVENTPTVPRLMCLAGEEFQDMFNQSHLNHTAHVKNGDVVIGSLAAIRTDHILFGAKAGLAAKALAYDYLVIATGTSYGSDIKTEGTSIEHRRRSFQIEHERLEKSPAAVVVGGGLVGTEFALDIATHFPEKKVEWLSGSEKILSRGVGFHEAAMDVVEREAAKGYLKLSLGERATSVDQAGSLITDKGNETTPGARAYWCTGYRANNSFMKDPRTAASVASCLDDEGFINTGPTHQLAHPALSHVFAGGDICTKEKFGGGERMAGFAHAHAFLICENIERLTGTKSGPLQAAHIGVPIENKGVDGAAKTANELVLISLGKTDTLLYSKVAYAVPFYQTPDAMEEKYGKIDEAPDGWVERGDLSAFKFAGWHDMFFGALGEGRDEWWAQFDAPRLYDAP
jgi:NADH dehydrogenase FAD-containing subunit